MARQRGGLGAELLGQAEGLDEAVTVRLGEPGVAGRLDAHDHPLRPEPGRHPARGAHDPGGEGARADAHQDALGDRPRSRDGVVAAVDFHLGVHPGRGGPERQLPERDQVALAEEAADGLPRLLRDVHLPVAESLDQVVGRQVDQLDLVGRLDDRVGDRLARRHPGDARDDVVQAFEMLDVEGAVHVDAGREQLRHVLPALRVARAGRVRVGQLVDQDQRRTAGEGGVQVELAQAGAAVLDGPRRQPLQPGQERLGVGPAVRLDPADDDVDAGGLPRAGRLQHGVRLPDPGGGAEEDLQLAARLARLVGPHALQQLIGIRAALRRHPSVLSLLAVLRYARSLVDRKGTVRAGACENGQGTRMRRGFGGSCQARPPPSRARFSRSTLTRGSPRTPSCRPSTWASTSCRTRVSSSPRALATRRT